MSLFFVANEFEAHDGRKELTNANLVNRMTFMVKIIETHSMGHPG